MSNNIVIFKNEFYQVRYDKQKLIQFSDRNGICIISNFYYYIQSTGYDSYNGHKPIEQLISANNSTFIYDNTERMLDLNVKHSFGYINIKFIFSNDTPEVKVKLKSIYYNDIQIIKEAIVFKPKVDLSYIVLKNSKLISKQIADKYWIAKQGAIYGKGDSSFFLYHVPFISSLEIDKNQLFVNLDYAKDHPYINPDPEGIWLDLSNSQYTKGQFRENSFSFYIGYDPSFFPRLMRVPYAFQSVYVWTEHACNTDLRMHKAVYYGSECINNARDSTGGFVKHGIPVTKSVFYCNKEKKEIHTSSSIKGEMVSILNSSEFFNFLEDIYKTGNYEICLHCTQPITSSRQSIEESLAFMKQNFASESWIDHLALKNKKISGCFESFSCYGLQGKSEHNISKIWNYYGIKYFWNNSLEYIGRKSKKVKDPIIKFLLKKYYSKLKNITWKILTRLDLIKKLRTLKKRISHLLSPGNNASSSSFKLQKPLNMFSIDQSVPNPIYWKHPTRTKNFYSWATQLDSSYYFKEGDNQNIKQRLSDLADSWGIFIHHSYPCRAKDDNACWEIDSSGRIIVGNEFDNVLSLMAKFRDENRIYFTTIKKIMEYWLLLDNIRIEYTGKEGIIKCYNNNNKRIEGLSFVCFGDNIHINGKQAITKRIGNETIFTFDLEPNSVMIIDNQ